MNQFKSLVMRYPTRIKYGLIIINIFMILIAIRMYINFVSIENTIQDTAKQSRLGRLELSYSENFLINYEKSPYAKHFLQHKNNILSKGEFIIKFDALPTKTIKPESETVSKYDQRSYLSTPTQSRNYFISDKFSKIR